MTPPARRILLLSSDWKWTGPAEPMLELAGALRAQGAALWLACPPGEAPGERSLAGEAEARGLAPALRLAPGRAARPLRDVPDVARLRAFLERHDVEVVHCWHTRDHVLALRAARARRRAGRTLVVRSWRSAEPLPAAPWTRWLLGAGADGLLVPSPALARELAAAGGRPVAGHFGAVDLARFAPEPPDPEVRRALGLPPDALVVGVVARVQRHRRFDLLLAAAARLFARLPQARLVIVGRGTHREELAERPAVALGIAERVVFAGYRGADYPDVLRCFDVLGFLVPGSDGTCRAVLEAAACGVPAVTTRRGALPEIVADGETGLLCDETPEALAAGFEALLRDAPRRRALGAAARRRAEALFTPRRFADTAQALYAAAARWRGARIRGR
ncbi:MAG TPA: glycosyltransferase family 4 protein [Myxococcota bacterium]